MIILRTEIKIFLSHKIEDKAPAEQAAARLKSKGLGVYLDTIDPHISGDGPELGEYIRKALGECTQLLALVSEKTANSWWVPWEIGVATEKDYPLATYVLQLTTLPSYLRKWPVLTIPEHLDTYAEISKKRNRLIVEATEMRKSLPLESSTAAFHRDLKRQIGQ